MLPLMEPTYFSIILSKLFCIIYTRYVSPSTYDYVNLDCVLSYTSQIHFFLTKTVKWVKQAEICHTYTCYSYNAYNILKYLFEVLDCYVSALFYNYS